MQCHLAFPVPQNNWPKCRFLVTVCKILVRERPEHRESWFCDLGRPVYWSDILLPRPSSVSVLLCLQRQSCLLWSLSTVMEGTSKTLQITGRHQTHPNYTWPCLMVLRGNAFQGQPEMQLCRWMGAVCRTARPCHHSLGTQRAALRSWSTGSLRVPWPDSMWRRPFPSPDGAPCDRNLC